MDKIILVKDKHGSAPADKIIPLADLPALFPPTIIQAVGKFDLTARNGYPMPDGTNISIWDDVARTWVGCQFKASPTLATDVGIGSSLAECAANLATMIASRFGRTGKAYVASIIPVGIDVSAGSDYPGPAGDQSTGNLGISDAGSGYLAASPLSGGSSTPQSGNAYVYGDIG